MFLPNRAEIAANPNTSSTELEELARLSPELAKIVAGNTGCKPPVLQKIIQSDLKLEHKRNIYKAIAKNPNADLDTLKLLVASSFSATKKLIAERDNLPQEIVIDLAKCCIESVEKRLVKNKTITKCILFNLGTHSDDRVRKIVAKHWQTPAHLLSFLSKDDSLFVRQAVAQNRNTPPNTLQELAFTKGCELAALSNPNTPVEILGELLTILSQDPCVSVRECVAKHPQTPLWILSSWFGKNYHLTGIAQNPNAPVDFLLELLNNYNLRPLVAGNPATPIATLEQLSQDCDYRVYRAVARNPNTPKHVIEALAQKCYALREIAKNPNTPVDILVYIANLNYCKNYLLKNPNTPPEVRDRLKKSPC